MNPMPTTFLESLALIFSGDADLIAILLLSLHVTLIAVAAATLCGLISGTLLACISFPGRRAIIVIFEALMGLPPVVIGLIVYLLLSRTGPFGALGLLFTPKAMIIAQFILTYPIITALAHRLIAESWPIYRDTLIALGAGPLRRVMTMLFEGRLGLVTIVLAGLGRAWGEVGAVMIVGGNIDGATRVMTTAISLETSKGNILYALALGVVLILFSLLISTILYLLRSFEQRRHRVVLAL